MQLLWQVAAPENPVTVAQHIWPLPQLALPVHFSDTPLHGVPEGSHFPPARPMQHCSLAALQVTALQVILPPLLMVPLEPLAPLEPASALALRGWGGSSLEHASAEAMSAARGRIRSRDLRIR
jgi:hypothetical protein